MKTKKNYNIARDAITLPMTFLHHINKAMPPTNRWCVLVFLVPVAISCGSLFVYSVYGTQLAEKCKLDSTQAANLNISATIGTALGGVISGAITDRFGTQLPILISFFGLSLGYRWLYELYNKGESSAHVQLLAAMFLVGVGSVSGYFSCIKAVTVLFPRFKGSAQSVTIASFAISSLLFLMVSKFLQGDISQFLFFLHVSCGAILILGFLFVRIDGYASELPLLQPPAKNMIRYLAIEVSSSLLSLDEQVQDIKDLELFESLRHPVFWIHYLVLAIVQGLGQMYIYCVGYIVKALHYHYKSTDSYNPSLNELQALHVSLIALCSFAGRLSSGPQADFLVHKLGCQRHWILVFGLLVMLAGHVINHINSDSYTSELYGANFALLIASCLIGYSYGFSFSCYPAIISDIFNMRNYSVIWGVMYTSTTFGLTVMTKVFGYVYDKNSTAWDSNGDLFCDQGSVCYNQAFGFTTGSCVMALVVIVGMIYVRRQN